MALQSRDSGKQSSSVPGKRHLCCNFVSWSEIHHWDGWCGWFGSYLRLETTIKGWMKWKLLYKVNLIWTVLITVAEGHMLIQDLFTLFCSLILFACGALKNNFICSLHFYVQPDSTKVKLWLWHVQQRNFKIHQLENMPATICWMTTTFIPRISSGLLKLENISTSDQ